MSLHFPDAIYLRTHVFAGPMNPGAALIVKSCGTNISANVRDSALSHKIDIIFVDSESWRVSKLHYWFKSNGNFAELV